MHYFVNGLALASVFAAGFMWFWIAYGLGF